MKIEKKHNNVWYTLSNENLMEGDEVFPIARGRIDGDVFLLHEYDFSDFISGFPDEPHTIIDLKHSDYKPYQVRTSHGYSPIESYYKIIKTRE